MKNKLRTADFNRFSIHLPEQCVTDCHHQGSCDSDVEYWASLVEFDSDVTPEKIRAELKEYGAWDSEELADDKANVRRLLWIAAGNIQDEEINSI